MIIKQTQDVILQYFGEDIKYPCVLQHFDDAKLIYLEHFKDKTKALQEFNRRTWVESKSESRGTLEIMTEDERTELIESKVLKVQCVFYKGVE